MREELKSLIDRLGNVPQVLQDRPQWLVWRFVRKSGQDKPSKMPYYLNGNLRGWPNGMPPHQKGVKAVGTQAQPQVDQGHDLDRQALGTMQQAVGALNSGRWDGVGFAFLPGDGLIGIDVDGAIDPIDGDMADHCQEIIDRCQSYTELSPSGKGIHVIVRGETETFKCNKVGVEVFCGRQFFTVTGREFGGGGDVAQISQETLSWLRVLVKGRDQLPCVANGHNAEVARNYDASKQASRYCLAALEQGVQRMRMTTSGGRNNVLNEEAFGLAQLVHTGGISESTIRGALADAARSVGLADAEINGTMDSGIRAGLAKPRAIPAREPSRKFTVVPTRKRDDGIDVGGVHTEVPPEPDWLADESLPPSDESEPKRAGSRKRGGGGVEAAEQDDQFWLKVQTLGDRFRLVENTLTAWDHQDLTIWQIANMRVRFGQSVVKGWLSRVADERARTVKPADLLFEPGMDVAEHQINMFAGLTVKPIPCTSDEVAPMLALLRHLCSETAQDGVSEPGASADMVDNVVHWVLQWQALPLQKLGTKMQTACVFHGAQGTGKNMYWDMWRDLFGAYGVTVGQTEIEDKFNGWISRKLAIIGDEVVSRQEMYHNKNRLKSVVTQQEKFAIRGMQQETRWESNHANVVFLSNESQPLALEERDRRYLVIYTPLEADHALYQSVRDFKANDGLGKWLYYLMNYPLDGFDAHAKPIMTKAKEALIELNWKAPERFSYEWLEGFLDLPVRVCSAEQLYRAFRRWCDRQGERWPPSQALFTKAVERWTKERVKRNTSGQFANPMLVYKQIALKDEVSNARKIVRCWVPEGAGAPSGVTEGLWAHESVQAFESDLGRFYRTPGVMDEAAA